MEVSVRKAEEKDIPWLLEQLKVFSAFYGSQRQLFGEDETYTVDALKAVMEHHVFFVAERGTELLGFISGFFKGHPYNPAIKTLTETFWWVADKDKKKSKAALLLLEEFVKFGKENADWIYFTLGTNTGVKDKCLTKRGFKMKETVYFLENE